MRSVNDAVYCNCMPRKDGFGHTLERNALQRIAVWTKGRLAWIRLFALRVLNEGTFEQHKSARSMLDIEKRLDAARTKVLMQSISMPIVTMTRDL